MSYVSNRGGISHLRAPAAIRLEWKDGGNQSHDCIKGGADVDWHWSAGLDGERLNIPLWSRSVRSKQLTFAYVATIADMIPITLLQPIAMPFPVPRCADGRTSGV